MMAEKKAAKKINPKVAAKIKALLTFSGNPKDIIDTNPQYKIRLDDPTSNTVVTEAFVFKSSIGSGNAGKMVLRRGASKRKAELARASAHAKIANPTSQENDEEAEGRAMGAVMMDVAREVGVKDPQSMTDSEYEYVMNVSMQKQDSFRQYKDKFLRDILDRQNDRGGLTSSFDPMLDADGEVLSEKTEVEQDPDVKDEPGTQPKKYYKGLSKKEKEARAKQFKKGSESDDDDAKAYEPAPGDEDAKTKPSKHTKKYEKMFGEDLNEAEMHVNSLGKWVHKGPADYAEKLKSFFGNPDVTEKQGYGRVRTATWYNVDGFDSLTVEDENTVKYHPIPGVQVYVYGMKKLVVPKEMVEPLHKSSETIKIDQLKNEVTASCASTTICAVTLNFVMDCIAGKAQPTIQEYDNRVLAVSEDDKLDPDFEWWPDITMDMREKPLSESFILTKAKYLLENKGVRNKAKETGIPYSILNQVFKRGKAAWKTGHRPGTTPDQWGYARINSFATGGKTRTTADKDLWKKYQEYKKKKKKKKTKSEEYLEEATYQGKKVKLGDPIRNPSGSRKKFRVYVTHPKTGNVVKVEFGDPNMEIKRDDPKRRAAFRSRHGCDAVTYEDDRHTPKYWSCYQWRADAKVDN
jgi:hypothetical protein